jgi:Uma2 family endonuclease
MNMGVEGSKLTLEEYFKQETTAEFRSEYHNGSVLPLPANTLNHNRLAGGFCSNFNTHFENPNYSGAPYEAFFADARLWIPAYNLFTYPDVLIFQGEPALLEGRKDTLLDPLVIVEVLSDSTELYDRIDKFKMYRSLPSLQEYILISQYQIRVEQYALDSQGNWVFRDYEGPEAVLKLASVPFQIKLSHLYRKVVLDSSETRS